MDKKEATQIPWIYPASAESIYPQAGEVYQFEMPVSTRAGHYFMPGDLLYIHEATEETPYGEIGPRGMNWICRTRFGVSVWSTLESCIERGLLSRVERKKYDI